MVEAIDANSAHQPVIGMVKMTKDCYLLLATMVQMVKHECVHILTRSTRVRFRHLANSFFPFQMSYRIRKAFIFYKIKEIIKKLKIKDRVGLG